MNIKKSGILGPLIEPEPQVEFMPFVTISQLEYENLIRADEALKIATELVQATADDYVDIRPLKVVLGVSNK